MLCIDCFNFPSFSFPDMVIGFTQTIRTVPENSGFEGQDTFAIYISIATLRLSEREQPMIFRLMESASTAVVEPSNDITNPLFDALFGSRLAADYPIQEFFSLEPLEDRIPPLEVNIRADLKPETKECFTIRLFPVDVLGRRELFDCNEDDSGEDNYFCETTICIKDSHGRFAGNMNF